MKDEKEKTKFPKEKIITRKEMFRCKKCNQFKPLKEISYLEVTQRNRPFAFEHIIFNSKASVAICQKCRESLRRG